ncbi:hypothetical protein F5880DRAFT_1625766 [Lentinula raphanica]|nr:hypothetical protein F5880DRAFT_1625766 [Lentinula raphanica]
MSVRTTTQLPSSLLEQIQESNGHSTHNVNNRSKKSTSRKASRKQSRAERKQRKAEYFSSTNLKRPANTDDVYPPAKKARLNPTTPALPVSSQATFTSQGKTNASGQKKSKVVKIMKDSKGSHRPSRGASLKVPPMRTQQERNEDAYIEYLEAKLGYSKGKSKRFDDGLDDLFDFANSLEQPSSSRHLGSNKDEGELEDENQDHESTSVDSNNSDGSEDELSKYASSEGVDDIEEEEWHGVEQTDSLCYDAEESPNSTIEVTSSAVRYIPPHLRSEAGNRSSEEDIKRTRRIKGFLNRMSEQNIASILDSVEEIYRDDRRHDVTSTITTLIIDTISSHSALLDSYIALYAAFVSSLHKIIGIEFAAYFVQNAVQRFEQHLADSTSQDESDESAEDKGKEASNLVVLLSELYNFQVISCVLIFDIIRTLSTFEIREFHVELLLQIVRNTGQQLRTDDPLAMKDIIQVIQNRLDGQEESLSSRTHFMLETLNNLKMNKVKRLGTQNQSGAAVERLKKFLSGLNKKRHVLAHEPLRVTLEDLHSAETKGKWWLVGAAWGGDPLLDRQEGNHQTTIDVDRIGDVTASSTLMELAKKHGMNTDIRRSIFVVLMSSDDYVDACDRLSQLKLTEVQQREIIRVALHCCGNEKVYNPYYALVCQHLCTISHSYKITLQYCLWDFLRDLGETNVGGAEVIKGLQGTGDDFGVKSISSVRAKNLAQAFAWWIAKDSITLAVLKPIDFTKLKPQTDLFLRRLFTYMFLSSQTKSPLLGTKASLSRNRASIEEIFIKATRLQALAMGLVIFLSRGIRLEDVDRDTVKLVEWGIEIGKETLRTGLDIVPDL